MNRWATAHGSYSSLLRDLCLSVKILPCFRTALLVVACHAGLRNLFLVNRFHRVPLLIVSLQRLLWSNCSGKGLCMRSDWKIIVDDGWFGAHFEHIIVLLICQFFFSDGYIELSLSKYEPLNLWKVLFILSILSIAERSLIWFTVTKIHSPKLMRWI